MSEIKIVVASHGYLSKELIGSAEMIAGPMKNVVSLSLLSNMDPDEFREEVVSSIRNNEYTIALVDLFGGTPANVIASLVESYNIDIIAGASLPILLELYSNVLLNQYNSSEELINSTVKVGTEGIVHVNKILFNREGNDELD